MACWALAAGVALVGGLAMVPSPAAASPAPDLDAAFAEAERSHKPIVVEFWARWCGPCRFFESEVLRDPAVVTALDDVVFVRCDIDTRSGRAVGTEYHVRAVPTLLVLDANGRERMRHVGLGPISTPEDFVAFLHQAGEPGAASVPERARSRARAPVVEAYTMAFARQDVGFVDELVVGLRSRVPVLRGAEEIVPALQVHVEAGASFDEEFSYDVNAMAGFAVRQETATVGLYSGVGATAVGERVPRAVHVPIEIALSVDGRAVGIEAWFRARFLFREDRMRGSERSPADELALGIGGRLPWRIAGRRPVVGVAYQELLDDYFVGVWLGAALTRAPL